MPRYLMLLYAEERVGLSIPPELMAKAMESMGAYEAALKKAGALVTCAGLQPTPTARTLRMAGGTVVPSEAPGQAFVAEGGELKVHDGPYAETREQLGGFYLVEAEDMSAALAWAAQCPAAQWGPIEVRELAPAG